MNATKRYITKLMWFREAAAHFDRVHNEDESPLASTYMAYREEPREYRLSSINAVLNFHTRVSDIYNSPFDQVREQLRLLIESVKESRKANS